MSVKLKDLAAHLGLATATVSRALGGHEDISAATRQRVREAADKLGYQPAATALQLRTGRSSAIGLVLPPGPNPLGDPFFTELITGLAARAAAEGLDLTLTVPPVGQDELATYRRLVSARRVDGIVISRTRVQDERVDYLIEAGFPFATFGRTARAQEHAWLDIDGHHAMLLAVRRLVSLGHRRIAYVGAPNAYVYASHRLAGFREGVAEAHLGPNNSFECEGDLSAEGTERLVGEMLTTRNPPTAIICATDGMAIGALKAIRTAGLVPGRAVSVIGYGDLPFAEHTEPPLTTVSRPIRESGERLLELLLGRIAGRPVHELQELWKPTIVERQSDGFAPERPD